MHGHARTPQHVEDRQILPLVNRVDARPRGLPEPSQHIVRMRHGTLDDSTDGTVGIVLA